jgi:conjugal transfer pilin signal peptidase TrbI
MSFRSRCDALYRHFSRRLRVYLGLLIAFAVFSQYFMICINVSDSLPGTLFLLNKAGHPGTGDLAAFKHAGDVFYKPGTLFLKRVAGVAGSSVTSVEHGNGYRDFFVDGVLVGRAKPASKTGDPLEPGPIGTIPDGMYYMAGQSDDSFDSRYGAVGWVTQKQIIGSAVRIF